MSSELKKKQGSLALPIIHHSAPVYPARLLLQRLALLLGASSFLLLFPFISAPFPLFSASPPLALSEDGTLPVIEWTACDRLSDRYACAMYEVPMDYSGKEDGVVNLAMIRYAADVNQKRLGSLFVNPGGPGGSGVEFVRLAGGALSFLTGGSYDIVSWDPRGVGLTDPVYRCFDSALDEYLWAKGLPVPPYQPHNFTAFPTALDEFAVQMRQLIPYSRLQNIACEQRNRKAARFMGTVNVARDLKRMSRAAWRKGDVEKGVNYWGFSYGSVLGAYLTGILPDRVGRVVIDGVLNPVLWAGASQAKVLHNVFQDTDKVFEGFVEFCVKAGPSRCALATSPSQSKEELLSTISDIIDAIHVAPLLVPDASPPAVINSVTLLSSIFVGMYTPRIWPIVATHLKNVLEGDGSSLSMIITELLPFPANGSDPASSDFARNGVWCNDGKRTTFGPNATDRELADSYTDDVRQRTAKVSSWFGSVGLWNTCDGYTTDEAGFARYTGNFSQYLSNPILMIGNTYDPVTSVKNAYLFNKIQPQSRVVEQQSFGHCSFAFGSLCTIRHLQTYLLTGELPSENTVCAVDEMLFPPVRVDAFGGEGLKAQERGMLERSREVGEVLREMRVGAGKGMGVGMGMMRW